MTHPTKNRAALVALLIAITLALPATAKDLATVAIGADAVFYPQASGSLRLTVSGPDGSTFDKTFGPGEAAVFSAFDNNGYSRADGVYSWELSLVAAEKASRDNAGPAGLERRAETMSGAFTVAGGQLVSPELPEGSLAKDQVILDDLIVDGSACIGMDCANGESFGFDTLRLKENNLRIKFQDTSTTASFASNDWQITANDSANGGLNKFSIDDITGGKTPFTIEAGAPSHSLYVDDAGRIGVGTSTPVGGIEIHVKDGDSPTLRLEQDGSSGFTPQTWDIAGNEANFFVRDVTNGSKLPFKIKPSAPTSSLFVAASGNIGLETESPDAQLHVVGDAILIENSDSGTGAFAPLEVRKTDGAAGEVIMARFVTDSASEVPVVQFSDGTTGRRLLGLGGGDISGDPDGTGYIGIGKTNPGFPLEMGSGAHVTTGGVWTNASSRALKNNIRDLDAERAIDTLSALNPVRYFYNSEAAEEYVGFIAEDVPELVATSDRKSLSSMDIVAVLTKVVQQQQQTIDELHQRMAELENTPQ